MWCGVFGCECCEMGRYMREGKVYEIVWFDSCVGGGWGESVIIFMCCCCVVVGLDVWDWFDVWVMVWVMRMGLV